MLYVIRCANHEELTYRAGQDPIVHLECDFAAVVGHADGTGRAWAFTASNAGARWTEFFNAPTDLVNLDWTAISERNWAGVKDKKQAEFLLHRPLPWHLVERIGVKTSSVRSMVDRHLDDCAHRPRLTINPEWYY